MVEIVELTISLLEKLKTGPPVKQYRIGEVARFSGLSRQTVHNYTIMGLIREAEWSSGGHRLYGEEVFGRLAQIEQLKASNTLREIRLMFDRDQSGSGEMSDMVFSGS